MDFVGTKSYGVVSLSKISSPPKADWNFTQRNKKETKLSMFSKQVEHV